MELWWDLLKLVNFVVWHPVKRERLSKGLFHKLKACLFSCSNNNDTIMINLSFWDQHLQDKGLGTFQMIELHWVVNIWLFQWLFFKFSIQLLNLALQINLTKVSNWQAVTQNLGEGLLSDIFRISDFFWKLGGGIIIEHGTILGSLRYLWFTK